jgi:hypothetical protein
MEGGDGEHHGRYALPGSPLQECGSACYAPKIPTSHADDAAIAGTHPALIEALEPHEQKKQAEIAKAERMRQLQINNINALFDCEKKQTEDENKARPSQRCAAPCHLRLHSSLRCCASHASSCSLLHLWACAGPAGIFPQQAA